MTLVINTNVNALTAYGHLASVQRDLSVSAERLSSGLRINTAGDDAAGLALTQGMEIAIQGTSQALRNIQDAKNIVHSADGGLEEILSILQQARTLAVQASNDTYDDTTRGDLQKVMTQIFAHLDTISGNTEFDGQQLIDGTFVGRHFQIGYQPPDVLDVDISSDEDSAKGFSLTDLGLDGVSVATRDDAQSAIDTIDGVITRVATSRATLGALENRLDHSLSQQQVALVNLHSSQASIFDADYAEEVSRYSRAQIISQAATAMLAQANLSQQGVLDLIGDGSATAATLTGVSETA